MPNSHRSRIILTILITFLALGAIIGAGFAIKNKFFGSKTNGSNNLPGALFGPTSSSRAKNLDPDKIIYWTNKYRAGNNLPALTKNDKLTVAATTKVDDMFAKQYFEHVSPIGVAPADLVKQSGYNYKSTGENLALGDFKDEKDLVDAWMNSPGHRANILNIDYTEIGVASKLDNFEDRKPTWLSVQEFGKPLPNCSSPSPNTLNDINNKKTEYDNLISQISNLNSEAASLNERSNQKIQQGNDIYTATGDTSQAQPYWDEGNSLRSQAQAKSASSQTLIDQSNTLSAQIEIEFNTYNTQATEYNNCIKG